tara:strand:+ start:305 stop:508 length:204 start_codon:yes stop_codon:yes gene_type:complete
MKMSSLSFDVACSKIAGYSDNYYIEVTENYENCKYHISIFSGNGELFNIVYAKTEKDFFTALKNLKD